MGDQPNQTTRIQDITYNNQLIDQLILLLLQTHIHTSLTSSQILFYYIFYSEFTLLGISATSHDRSNFNRAQWNQIMKKQKNVSKTNVDTHADNFIYSSS